MKPSVPQSGPEQDPPTPTRRLRHEAPSGPGAPAFPDVATLSVTLPCYDGDGKIFAPPEEVLNVNVVGPYAFIDVCTYRETHSSETQTVTKSAMVDAWALLRALALQLGVSELIVGRSLVRGAASDGRTE